jgi:hypothetical protein
VATEIDKPAEPQPATPAERLRSAADLLGTLSDEATSAPWALLDPDPWGSDVEVRGPYNILVCGRATRTDGRAITTTRSLMPLIVAWLRDQAADMDRWLSYDTSEVRHYTPSCGALFNAEGLDWRCTCFDHPLAVADSILGGAV